MKFNKAIVSTQIGEIVRIWELAAMNYSMQYGVHIEVSLIKDDSLNLFCQGIEFKIRDQSFGSLNELRRVLRLKAFL